MYYKKDLHLIKENDAQKSKYKENFDEEEKENLKENHKENEDALEPKKKFFSSKNKLRILISQSQYLRN